MDGESKQTDRFDFDGFCKDERFWRELLKSLLPTLCEVTDLTREPEFMDQDLREEYTSFKDKTEKTKMRFKLLSMDHILNEGITIGEERARRSIMEHLIAVGISPQQAAVFIGMNV
jgi:hypothetical protein